MASAAARCSRLPQSSTEPRQPRNAASTSTTSRASGHHCFAYRARLCAHASLGMALLPELLTRLKVQRLNKAKRMEPAPPQKWPSRLPDAISAQGASQPKMRRQANRNNRLGQWRTSRPSPAHCGVSSAKYIDSSGGDVVRLYMRPRKSPGAIWRISSRLSA